jgi:hypothetical protein
MNRNVLYSVIIAVMAFVIIGLAGWIIAQRIGPPPDYTASSDVDFAALGKAAELPASFFWSKYEVVNGGGSRGGEGHSPGSETFQRSNHTSYSTLKPGISFNGSAERWFVQTIRELNAQFETAGFALAEAGFLARSFGEELKLPHAAVTTPYTLRGLDGHSTSSTSIQLDGRHRYVWACFVYGMKGKPGSQVICTLILDTVSGDLEVFTSIHAAGPVYYPPQATPELCHLEL